MRVMVIVKASDASERMTMPSTADLTAMTVFNEKLKAAGVIETGEGLHATARGKRVVLGDGEPRVEDGPFFPTTEQAAGFWIWKVADFDEAVKWAKQCPDPMPGGGVLEIRKIYETEDFGDALTPELKAREERLRAENP